jgi:hypothetical protein
MVPRAQHNLGQYGLGDLNGTNKTNKQPSLILMMIPNSKDDINWSWYRVDKFKVHYSSHPTKIDSSGWDLFE